MANARHYFLFCLLSFVDAATENLCEKCKCGSSQYLSQLMKVVNCTNAGITASTVYVLEQLPDTTEVLIFSGNHVPELPVNIFGGEKNLTNLKVIDMSSNGIEEIKGKTFHHVPLVERLILNFNSLNLSSKPHPRVFSNFDSLRELHLTRAFREHQSADLAEQLHTIFTNSNLSQLQKLHLEQNEIRSFADKKVFCDLKNLTDLYLSNNDLETLSFEIECLPHLRFIDLELNKIERFTKTELGAFDSFPKNNRSLMIDIGKNPFICDCVANGVYMWLKETKVTVRNNDTLECHYLHNTNKSILLKDSVCILETHKGIPTDSFEHEFAHYFFVTTSLILIICLTYICVKYSSVYCRHVVTPASKVHYIVIRNPDENREVHV